MNGGGVKTATRFRGRDPSVQQRERTLTIKTLAAVVGTLAIIVVLFFITKITTPSRLVAKSGFFAGSSADDWGRGTGATGFWEPIGVEGRQEQMPQ